ncbi:DMT family transporter [Falsigemmobacter faecalis]|uniref:DMT family transporter n=1 Tax=Falsigemmobacter faecalis TaxID=2488730 RepID=UPI001F288048|nr:DMT family transporter [Falsigemmobacter faecalis]
MILRTIAASSTLTGICFALAAGMIYSLNDMSIKFLSSGYPLHQIVATRSVIALVIVLLSMRLITGGWHHLRTSRFRFHALRVGVVFISNITYFLGLAALPLADAVATAYIGPVFITLLSIFFLGEKVGPHRWAAVVAGLIGTLVMVRPGAGTLQVAALLVVFSAFTYAVSQMMVRQMRGTESTFTMGFYMQAGFLLSSLTTGALIGHGQFNVFEDGSLTFLFRPWVWPTPSDLPFFIVMGLAIGAASLMMAQAYRTLEAAVAAPFEYIAIPMAVFWGLTVFGTLPDLTSFAGMALIIGSGLYTIWRETVKKKS